MNRKQVLSLILFVFVSATLVVSIKDGWFSTRSKTESKDTASDEGPSGVILSPQKDKGISFTEEDGQTCVWLVLYPKNTRRLVGRLGREESAHHVSWSPDGRLVAFESYNRTGHSPMTTTHVWVGGSDSDSLKEVRLPPPNERFSTYLDHWVSKDTLQIRSTLLDHPDDVFFLYRHPTGEVQGPVG